MTQEYDTTTERSSGFQGLGGGAYQQAFCNSARIALLAAALLYVNQASIWNESFKSVFSPLSLIML